MEDDCSSEIVTEDVPERRHKVRSGMVAVSDGKSRPRAMRLHLSLEVLRLQSQTEEEPVASPGRRHPSDHLSPATGMPTSPGGLSSCSQQQDDAIRLPPPDARERVVGVQRQRTGGLGLSIKGGSEHKLPILISRIFREQAADMTGNLFVGDAIVRVNDQEMYGRTHDQAVNILRNAGDTVTITVKHYKAATPFLQHNFPREDSSRSLNLDNLQNGDWRATSPVSRRSSAVDSTSSGRWTDVVAVPLLMAYVTRYIFGTDKLRPNAFEVRGLNGTSTGVIQCGDAAILSQWLKYVTDNIVGLTNLQVKLFNRTLPASERVEYMGWVNEGVLNNNQPWQCWRPRYLTLRSTDLVLSDTPPVSVTNWGDNCQIFQIYQSMFRVIKDSENVDERQHCFLLQTAGHESRYLSVETRQELLRIEAAWHCAVCSAVIKLKNKTFNVVWGGKPAVLTLDWNVGFVLADAETGAVNWKYKFSQLKGSSDDNKCRLKLHFQLMESRIIETREMECPTLQSLLFCMHAFLTAKVASVDPAFLSSKEP
ncbi:gamma-1-syntrophin isoform X1 [Cloeon dipterum]|uniref:gamma-1-syntrophin isoform X1 n=1 Tax=Cloeon dipterum TaxID=197152 RepID=UPI0032208636